MFRKVLAYLFAAALLVSSALAIAQGVPSEIKIGTLYASSGRYAAISMPVHYGLKLWIDGENAKGGVMVKPYGKRIPIKLIAYDDQSNTATAATLYNQLVTQDKVDIFVADSGSVLTAPAVSIARDHKMLLFDQTGTGTAFFSSDNPYIVELSDPVASLFPKNATDFLIQEGPKLGIKRVAILFATNEFSGGQANSMKKAIDDANGSVKVVYFNGVSTDTSNYTVLVNNIRASKPDAVVHFGYPTNDIAFLRSVHDSGIHFKWMYSNYPGLELDHMLATVGANGLSHVYTLTTAANIEYAVTSGMNLTQFRDAWNKAYGNSKVSFGFNSIAGYTTGVVLENVLATTKSMKQLDLREAVFNLSGKLKTLDGPFELAKDGSQTGEIMPLAQLMPDGKGGLKFAVVYPPDVANSKPVYPSPVQ